MKIGIIRKKYTPFGGAERYVDALVETLLKMGHDVHIFAEEWKHGSSASLPAHREPCFHRIRTWKGLSVFEVLSFAINSQRLLKREHFDVIHSFERTLYQDIYRAGDGCHKEWLIQRAKLDPVWKTLSIRLNPLHHALLWIEKQIFNPRNTRLVIVNSTRGRDEIRSHYRFPEDRILVIHNGIDSQRFNVAKRKALREDVRQSYRLKRTDPVLLFVGSGFRRKGLAFALKALSRTGNPQIKMIVCGRDKPNRYLRLSKKLGIEAQVLFVGPTKEPERLYAAADIFILPTIYEPFSNACLEALNSGLPVITTQVNGISDFIQESENGVCVEDPSDISRMAEAIAHFVSKKEELPGWTPAPPPCLSIEDHTRKVASVYEKFAVRSEQL